MSLKKEKIVANTKKFMETAKKFGFLTQGLEELLLTDEAIIKTPASSFLHLHNAFEGGLADHILRVMKKAYQINENLLPEMQISVESLVKVVYLHQLGKINLYIKETDAWQRENRGKMYDFNEDLVSMRIGERSIYYATKFGIKLTEEEFGAIVNYDKVDDTQSEWHNTTLGDILKMAVKLAIMEEKFLAKK